MEKTLQKWVKVLNKTKKRLKLDNQTLAGYTNPKLTPEVIESMLSGQEAANLTYDNMKAVDAAVIKAFEVYRSKISSKLNKLLEKQKASN